MLRIRCGLALLLACSAIALGCDSDSSDTSSPNDAIAGGWLGQVTMDFYDEEPGENVTLTYEIKSVQTYDFSLTRASEGRYAGSVVVTDDGVNIAGIIFSNSGNSTTSESAINRTRTYPVEAELDGSTLEVRVDDGAVEAGAPFSVGAFRVEGNTMSARLDLRPIGFSEDVRTPLTLTLTKQ